MMKNIHPRVLKLLSLGQGHEQKSAEWLAMRRELLTASDAAAALGIKPYPSFSGSPRSDLMRRKLSNATFCSAATAHGNAHEDDARRAMCEVLGETVYDFGLLRHDSVRDEGDESALPWLGASPDGITATGRMVEIKCPVSREIVPGHVPHHYYPQLQIQMEVCDLDQAIFVEYRPATASAPRVLSIVAVERDREWFRRHKGALHAFWCEYMDRRASYVPPPPPKGLVEDGLYQRAKRQKTGKENLLQDDKQLP